MLRGIIIGIIATLVVEHVGLARVGALADRGAGYLRAAGAEAAEASREALERLERVRPAEQSTTGDNNP